MEASFRLAVGCGGNDNGEDGGEEIGRGGEEETGR